MQFYCGTYNPLFKIGASDIKIDTPDVKIDGDHTIKSKIVANLQSAITLKSCE